MFAAAVVAAVEAAAAVADSSLPILQTLVDKTLIQSGARYDMHELLRQYAEGRVVDPAGRRLDYRALATPCYLPPEDRRERFLFDRFALTGATGVVACLAHDPWPVAEASIAVERNELLAAVFPPLRGRLPECCHLSPGVENVLVGIPQGNTAA